MERNRNWNWNRNRNLNRLLNFSLIICLILQNLNLCFSLNDEGFSLLRFKDKIVNDPFKALSNWKYDRRVINPCSWFGVNCSNGHVVALLVDNNKLVDSVSSDVQQLTLLPKTDQNRHRNIRPWNIGRTGTNSHRKLLQQENILVPIPPFFSFPPPTSPSPSPSPFPSSSPQPPVIPTPVARAPSAVSEAPPGPPAPSSTGSRSKRENHLALILSLTIGGSALVGVLALMLCRGNKVATVRPWGTGLSGQLQKAFVTGVPKLKRSELEAACEDFSNVIGQTSFGTVYKGTLSSGVEIAVASAAAPSAKDWSKHHENLFRKRIDTLSKVNHKNFVNLLGYCEDDLPFTRMIAFEYAPNGTLFEHLHIQEAEHLNWSMRLRIVMGMAYCLDYMHHLTPPISHNNLTSSSVNLTEDYASKISDFGLCNDSSTAHKEQTPESNVYSFGIILFEIITGKIPYAVGDTVSDWVIDFLKGEKRLTGLVDPTLDSCDVYQLEAIGHLIRSCVNSDPKRRPKMIEIACRLKEITGISQDGATPKISPLWWAELEILSTEAT